MSQHGLKLIIIHMIEIYPHFYYHYVDDFTHKHLPNWWVMTLMGPPWLSNANWIFFLFIVNICGFIFKKLCSFFLFSFEFVEVEIFQLLGVCEG